MQFTVCTFLHELFCAALHAGYGFARFCTNFFAHFECFCLALHAVYGFCMNILKSIFVQKVFAFFGQHYMKFTVFD